MINRPCGFHTTYLSPSHNLVLTSFPARMNKEGMKTYMYFIIQGWLMQESELSFIRGVPIYEAENVIPWDFWNDVALVV